MAKTPTLFGEQATPDAFEAFWQAYPKRSGNPKKPAREVWDRLIRKGVKAERMQNAVELWAPTQADLEPSLIPHARTWLYQQRFYDVLEEVAEEQRERVDHSAERLRKKAECVKRCRRNGLPLPGHITTHDILKLEQEGLL